MRHPKLDSEGTRQRLARLLSVALLCLVAAPATAQEEQQVSVLFPSETGMLRMTAAVPEEIHAGEEFTYVVQVENVAENVILHDIQIQQRITGDLQINEAQLGGNRQQGQAAGDQQNPGSGWTIQQLLPGESETIDVTATANSEGELLMCMEVTSYRPALCLTANVVRAELEIAKEAPERANVCEIIEWAYYVQNDGTAEIESLTIVDPLPDGLRTIDGDERLEFTIDGLGEGEIRKFVAELIALRAGEYSSSALAVAPNGARVRSSRPTTIVEAPELAIEIEGPTTGYFGELASYTVRVSNVGNAIAPDAQLAVGVPESIVELARITDVQYSTQTVRQEGIQQDIGARPRRARGQQDQGQQQQRRQEQRGQEIQEAQPVDLEYREIDLGNLEPGQTMELRFTARPEGAGVAVYRAAATFVCRPGEEEREVVAEAVTRTEFIALPALLVAVVDADDPVRTGDEATYHIVVKNQGAAADHDVQIVAELPEQLEYVAAEGPTEAQVEGNQITFEPIEQLAPGEEARWRVAARVTSAGDVIFKTRLTSEAQQQPASSEEPTQLVR